VWSTFVALIGAAVSAYGQRVITRWHDPSVNRQDLLNEISGVAFWSLFLFLIVVVFSQAVTCSRVIIRRRQRLGLATRPFNARRAVWGRGGTAFCGADVVPGFKCASLILGVLAVFIALLAWLLPVR